MEGNQFHKGPEHSNNKESRINGPTVRGICPVGTPPRPMLYRIPPVYRLRINYRLQHRFHRSKYRIVKEESLRPVLLTRLAAALLLLAVLRSEVDNGLAGARLVLTRLARVKGFAGDDAVDF